jgi:serine phosphatase RsbU (regulator of sigma subunit)
MDRENGMAARRVFVVEPDAHVRGKIQRRLRSAGFETDAAANGTQALEAIAKDPPRLVIASARLPEMAGRELSKRVKSIPGISSPYIILLADRNRPEDFVAPPECGVDEVAATSCGEEEFIARVKAGLRIAGLQRNLEQANQRLGEAQRRIDRELHVVAGIQRALLPQKLPQAEGLEFAAYYRPSSESGGDYYDALPLAGGKLCIVIADVSGHGAPAMVAMALTRYLVHSIAPSSDSPARALELLHSAMRENLPTEQYVTMFYGILDPRDRVLRYCSAGQTAPCRYFSATGEVAPLDNCEGYPIKLVPETEYEDFSVRIGPGDKILFYTDGVTEMMNCNLQLYGDERLRKSFAKHAARPPRQRISQIVQDLEAFANGHPQADDITMLMVDFL